MECVDFARIRAADEIVVKTRLDLLGNLPKDSAVRDIAGVKHNRTHVRRHRPYLLQPAFEPWHLVEHPMVSHEAIRCPNWILRPDEQSGKSHQPVDEPAERAEQEVPSQSLSG